MSTESFARAFQPWMDYSNEAASDGVASRAMPASFGDDLSMAPEGNRILIVDDNPSVLNPLADLVDHMGYRPSVAEDGIAALCKLKDTHYDILLTDFEMPGMDGFELAVAAKQQCFGTKVIIMTGHCAAELGDRISASGAVDDFLLKPFDLDTLKEKLKRVGRKRFAKLTA